MCNPYFVWLQSARKGSFYIVCTFDIVVVSVDVFADMAVVVVDAAGAAE